MAKTPSTMLELTTSAPDFTLADASGQNFVLADQEIDKGLLVIFMCNHCPFVIHIREKLVDNILRYQEQGLTVMAINSNDYRVHQDDNPEKMAEDANQFHYSFPYLVDEDQSVAKAYRAACTPDLYLFDSDKKLVYRGQFDGSRPGNNVPVTGADLSAAVDELVGGKTITVSQQPSLGCNIKWKPGNEPDYFN